MNASEQPDSLSMFDAMLKQLEPMAGQEIRLSNLLEAMSSRGFGLVYIVFGVLAAALPAVLCSIMSIPILLFSLQQLMGRQRPTLPPRFDQKKFSADAMSNGLNKARPWLNRVERFAKSRWPLLCTALITRIAALICFLLALVILIPGPFTNTPPGIVIALFGFAMTGRDGMLMLLTFLASILAFFISLSAISAFVIVLYVWASRFFA